MKKVIVKWYDSNILHGWQYGEYPTELVLCETMGYIIGEDDRKVVLAQTVSESAQMGVTIIAKGTIKSVKEVRVR